MSEYADMMINGETCQYCIAECPHEPTGYPWTCSDCRKETNKFECSLPTAEEIENDDYSTDQVARMLVRIEKLEAAAAAVVNRFYQHAGDPAYENIKALLE